MHPQADKLKECFLKSRIIFQRRYLTLLHSYALQWQSQLNRTSLAHRVTTTGREAGLNSTFRRVTSPMELKLFMNFKAIYKVVFSSWKYYSVAGLIYFSFLVLQVGPSLCLTSLFITRHLIANPTILFMVINCIYHNYLHGQNMFCTCRWNQF